MKKGAPNNKINAAVLFSWAGAAAAFTAAAFTASLCLPGEMLGWRGLPDVLILLLGGWGMLKGKRLASVALTAYLLASRWMIGAAAGITGPMPSDLVFFPAYTLGIIGAFERNRAARAAAGAADRRLLDADIAASFVRVAGAAGISFGALVAMFSLAEMGGFSVFNLTDGLLIILFAFHTFKRKVWALAAQLALNFTSMALAYAATGSPSEVFGFFPIFLFELYALGLAGAIALKDKDGRAPLPYTGRAPALKR